MQWSRTIRLHHRDRVRDRFEHLNPRRGGSKFVKFAIYEIKVFSSLRPIVGDWLRLIASTSIIIKVKCFVRKNAENGVWSLRLIRTRSIGVDLFADLEVYIQNCILINEFADEDSDWVSMSRSVFSWPSDCCLRMMRLEWICVVIRGFIDDLCGFGWKNLRK